MSAVGARPEAATTLYHRTKWQAEDLVRHSALPYVILRPSLINGPENAPIRTLARLHHALPVIPVFGDGRFPTQPVWIEDVALAFTLAAERDDLTGTFELGGPEVLTYEQLVLAVGRSGRHTSAATKALALLDAHPPEKVARYQRFTRPSRDVVIVSKRDPRRSTTVVLDAPHAMPVGPNVISGFDTSRRTPASRGPTQRSSGVQVRSSQRSILNESAATTSRARAPRMIATWRVTARAVVTLTASVSTASQSSTPPSRGRVTAVTTATTATVTMSSTREKPRRMAPN